MDSIVIHSNREDFMKINYKGISVLIDNKNYFNASKICSDCGVRFSYISRNKNWIEYIKKLSDLLEINEEDLIIDKLFNDGYSLDIQGIYIHSKLVNYLLFQISLISEENLDYVILIGEIKEALNDSIIKSKSNKSNRNKFEKLTSEINDFIIEFLNKFEDGITLNELKCLYSKKYGCYIPKKFKIFKSKLKEKMINNGEYRPVQFETSSAKAGSRPRIYKLKDEIIDLYKNEFSNENAYAYSENYSE